MIRREDVVHIGKLNKPHGLNGELNFTFSDDTWDSADCDYLICDVDGILVPFFLEEYRFKNDQTALVKFEDMDSVETVDFLVGCDVYLEKKYMEEKDEDEMPLSYFIGFNVTDAYNGDQIGTIEDVDDSTDNWLFVLKKNDGTEILLPAHEDLIAEIDMEGKVIKYDLPEGL